MNIKDFFSNNERNQDFLKKISEPLKRSFGLSPRTIQSYIVNAKNRLGILSREELIENAKILHLAGLLK